MANGIRRTGLYGFAGVLMAAVIIAGFVASSNLMVQGMGTLTIKIMDKPVELQNLFLEIDWVKIKAEDEKWLDLTLEVKEGEEYFNCDLLSLQEVSETLAETEIPEGNYVMLWIHVNSAEAVWLGETEEDAFPLKVPSDVIKVLFDPPLNVGAGADMTVLIDLQPQDLGAIAISESLNLRPVIKAIGTEPEQVSTPTPTPTPTPTI